MLNQKLLRKVSSLALTGVVFAVSLLSPVLVNPVFAASEKLEITNSNDKAIVDRGEVVNYTVVVKNTGTQSTSNTFLWINTPNLATYVAASATAVKQPANLTKNLDNNWVNTGVNFGTLQAGDTVTLRYQSKVAGNANPNDIIWSVATLKSDQTSQISASSYSRMVFKETALCATKTADKSVVEKGDVVTFTIKICNRSNINLTQVLVRDKVQAPLRYVAGSTTLDIDGKTLKIEDSWQVQPNDAWINIGNLPPGYEAVLKFRVTVAENVTNGQVIENVAQVNAKELEKPVLCAVKLTGKVLGVTTQKPPTQLPDTGPGEALLLLSTLVPAGYLIKKFRSKI
ncbi:MAG TPA: hypothetical protein VIH52_01655 [Candidatus Nanoarchaeia archaeon]